MSGGDTHKVSPTARLIIRWCWARETAWAATPIERSKGSLVALSRTSSIPVTGPSPDLPDEGMAGEGLAQPALKIGSDVPDVPDDVPLVVDRGVSSATAHATGWPP